MCLEHIWLTFLCSVPVCCRSVCFSTVSIFHKNFLKSLICIFLLISKIYHFVLTSITFLKVSCFKGTMTVNMKYFFEFLSE